jgi:hypothetical protein
MMELYIHRDNFDTCLVIHVTGNLHSISSETEAVRALFKLLVHSFLCLMQHKLFTVSPLFQNVIKMTGAG